jgi:hypothetical protein
VSLATLLGQQGCGFQKKLFKKKSQERPGAKMNEATAATQSPAKTAKIGCLTKTGSTKRTATSILSALLAVMLTFSLLPIQAFASEIEGGGGGA